MSRIFSKLKKIKEFEPLFSNPTDLAKLPATKDGLKYLLDGTITEIKFESADGKIVYNRLCTNNGLVIRAKDLFSALFKLHKVKDIVLPMPRKKTGMHSILKTFDLVKGDYITVSLENWKVVDSVIVNWGTIEALYNAVKRTNEQ